MIKSVWVINPNGNYLELDLRKSGYQTGLYVFNLEGIGSPVATVNGKGGPNFDGVRVNSVRADARQITFSVALPGPGAIEEEAKAKLYEYFPSKKEITFGVVTDSYEIQTKAFVEHNDITQFSKIENAKISLYCADPYFREKMERAYWADYFSGIPNFQFPFSNEDLVLPLIEFGYDTDKPTIRVGYIGGIETGATISLMLLGDVQDIVIANGNGSQIMNIDLTDALANWSAPSINGDRVVINTKVGEKSINYIRGGVSFNMINGVGMTDDWIQILPGINTITFDAAVGVDKIEADLVFYPRREGV